MNINVFQMKYEINMEKKIRILGEKFVQKNFDKCKIIYKNKIFDCQEYIDVNHKESLIKLKLYLLNDINDLSYMFAECSTLIEFSFYGTKRNIEKFNVNEDNFINDINNFYSSESSYLSIENEKNENTLTESISLLSFNLKQSKLKINNTKSFINCFSNCQSLKVLPDISEWNTDKNNNFHGMFSGCSKLLSIPDISKWNTGEVIDMSYIFYNCSSLLSIPDISNWNTSNV